MDLQVLDSPHAYTYTSPDSALGRSHAVGEPLGTTGAGTQPLTVSTLTYT